jgi:hypothetical protein
VRLLQRRLEKRDLEIFHLRRCHSGIDMISLSLSLSLSSLSLSLSVRTYVNACVWRLEKQIFIYSME